MRRWFYLVFSSQIFVALCAVALTCESGAIAGLDAEPLPFYTFIFLATLTAYRLHSRARGCECSVGWTLAAAVGAALLSPWIGVSRLPLMAAAGLLAWAYSMPVWPGTGRLREHGIAKLLTLTGVWTLVTAVVPLMHHADGTTIAVVSARRFLFMLALCIAFDIRDAESDRRANIRTLPVLLGTAACYRWIRRILLAFCLLGLATSCFSSRSWQAQIGIGSALVLSGLATWVVIEATRHRRSPLIFLAFVDGMMLLQCVLVMLAGKLPIR